ncbi:hypothetical protein BGX38DRAFT_1157091 [Terfezia claveryi]|nr:hypothetical protein BGX38DRAFT_1157091 [Terfezia claveryi]
MNIPFTVTIFFFLIFHVYASTTAVALLQAVSFFPMAYCEIEIDIPATGLMAFNQWNQLCNCFQLERTPSDIRSRRAKRNKGLLSD